MRWLAALALFAAACSQPALSVEAYADAMEGVAWAYVAESQDLSARYQASVEDDVKAMVQESPPDPEAVAVEIASSATVNYLAVLADAMQRFIEGMEALRPPPAVQAAQKEFIAAVRSVHGAIPSTRDAVLEADSIESVGFALTSSGFADGQIRWTAACAALEAATRGLGTGLDLGCVRPVVTP